jgi:hypothetical protein
MDIAQCIRTFSYHLGLSGIDGARKALAEAGVDNAIIDALVNLIYAEQARAAYKRLEEF